MSLASLTNIHYFLPGGPCCIDDTFHFLPHNANVFLQGRPLPPMIFEADNKAQSISISILTRKIKDKKIINTLK